MAKPTAKKKEPTARASMTISDFHAKYSGNITDVRKAIRGGGYRPTGSIAIDRDLLNGGFPKGGNSELWGPPQSGKSTVALATASVVLAEGGRVAYFDLERGLDLVNEADWEEDHADPTIVAKLLAMSDDEKKSRAKRRTSWLRTNGIDPLSPNFVILDPDHGEHMCAMIADIIVFNLFDLVIVDSVAAIITRAELEGEPGESHFGQVAKLLSTEFKRFMKLFSTNPNTTILWINQARDKIGYMAKGQKSTGGMALEHFGGTKVRFRKIGREEKKDDVVTESIVSVDKSRYTSAGSVTIYISGKRGLDVLKELLDFAVDFLYVHQAGSWYYLFEEPLEEAVFKAAKDRAKIPGLIVRVNSEEAMIAWLHDNGWQERLASLAAKTY